MTDIHCHILPGMDDGSPSVAVSEEMLRMQAEQGMDTVVLTSHFYRHHEHPEDFLARQRAAWEELQNHLRSLPEEVPMPRLLTGAEVAWVPNMEELMDLSRFCIGGTRNLLLELPFQPWQGNMVRQIYDMMGHTGITPVIAHIERYIKFQRRDLVDAVFSLGVPVQISAELLLHPFTRRMALKLLRSGRAQFIASDSHNLTTRKPNMGPAIAVLRQKLGEDFVVQMGRRVDALAGISSISSKEQ